MKKDMENIINVVNVINSANKPGQFRGDRFYRLVNPFTGDPSEVYNRLTGWRKECFRQYIMSGMTILDGDGRPVSWRWNANGFSGMHRDGRHRVWVGNEERYILVNWEELCDLYA